MTKAATKKPSKATPWWAGKLSPESRTVRYLQARGWTADVVERQSGPWIKHDLFGLWDVYAMRDDTLSIGVQATTADHAAARIAKVAASPLLALWLKRHNGYVFGWREVAKTRTWEPNVWIMRRDGSSRRLSKDDLETYLGRFLDSRADHSANTPG